MYDPTENYYQVKADPIKREAFELAAQEASQERFVEGLHNEGFATAEEAKAHLLKLGEVRVLDERCIMAAGFARNTRANAGKPNLYPEVSFRLLVDAYAIEKHIGVLKSAITELNKAKKA